MNYADIVLSLRIAGNALANFFTKRAIQVWYLSPVTAFLFFSYICIFSKVCIIFKRKYTVLFHIIPHSLWFYL